MVVLDCPVRGTKLGSIPLCSSRGFVWLEFFAPLLSSMYSLMYLTASTWYLV